MYIYIFFIACMLHATYIYICITHVQILTTLLRSQNPPNPAGTPASLIHRFICYRQKDSNINKYRLQHQLRRGLRFQMACGKPDLYLYICLCRSVCLHVCLSVCMSVCLCDGDVYTYHVQLSQASSPLWFVDPLGVMHDPVGVHHPPGSAASSVVQGQPHVPYMCMYACM